MKEIEIWKNVDENYMISNLGNVKSLDRIVKHSKGGYKKIKGKILKKIKSKGYHSVSIYNQGKVKIIKVHKLVAVCFIPNNLNKPHINHKDGNKLNNCVGNLEWCTASENLIHAYKNKLRFASGISNPKSKLKECDIFEIRESKLTQKEISKIYNVDQSTISYIKSRKTWNHI